MNNKHVVAFDFDFLLKNLDYNIKFSLLTIDKRTQPQLYRAGFRNVFTGAPKFVRTAKMHNLLINIFQVPCMIHDFHVFVHY